MGKYSLTEQERKWLKQRDSNLFSFGLYLAFTPGMSPALIDYRDAAEFEARAKVIALHLDIEDVPCAHGMTMFCPAKHFKGKGCGDWCRMRIAHLQAEREMDNE